jgi:hypothetical protein
MKEPKPYLLTLVTIFLLISAGLLATTIYLYFNNTSQTATVNPNKKNAAVKTLTGTRDSLEKIYTATIKDLDASFTDVPAGYRNTPADKDQVNDLSNKKTNDTSTALYKLRNEINTILSDKSSTADLESAKAKISELQNMVENLKNKNNLITKENERLYSMLKQVTNNSSKSEPVYKNTKEETVTPTKATGEFFKADNIQVSATTSSEFLEKETTKAGETDKLVGSFTLKNNSSQNTVSEIMVVVLQPDGKVLQTSNWETGIFYTSAGKQIYSKKLRFNNNSSESKKINFSLQAEKYLPGKYTIEVYHDGSLIGQAIKILS